MRRLLAALVLGLGLSCGDLPPAQTAQLVVTSTSAVLDLVAAILAQLCASPEGEADPAKAAVCTFVPSVSSETTADPTTP